MDVSTCGGQIRQWQGVTQEIRDPQTLSVQLNVRCYTGALCGCLRAPLPQLPLRPEGAGGGGPLGWPQILVGGPQGLPQLPGPGPSLEPGASYVFICTGSADSASSLTE